MLSPLDKIFYPTSIAIIGASSKEGSLSYELVNNLINYRYNGKIFPVNPKSDSVHSIKSYRTIKDITDDIDLAILMLPRDLVLPAIDDCAVKKIESVVVITAGFKETGAEGAEIEKKLVEKIRKYGMRLVGPNCMGIINTNPSVKLNGTFVLGKPIHGGIGFVSQSGALGAAVLKTVEQNDIGLAQFISIGNKADVSGNTILEYWWNNDDIKVITVYLESFGNPRKFMELTREITKTKPVIVIKSARTSAGMKAASSHTGALASNDVVVDAFLEQGGVIRVSSTDEMFDIAKAFDRAKLPLGNRVGILTNAGGPAILAVDECTNNGLLIPELDKRTQEKLRAIAPKEASVFNPVDLLPPADSVMYSEAARIMLEDKNIDSLIIVLGPPLMLDTLEIAGAICRSVKNTNKTVTLVLMSQDDIIPKLKEVSPEHPPLYRFPENAARTISRLYNYKLWKEAAPGNIIKFDSNKSIVKKILLNYRGTSGIYLDFEDVHKILSAYGLPVIHSTYAQSIEELLEIAPKLKYPVVIKAMGKNLVHKSDMGAVEIDIHTEHELVNSAKRIIESLEKNNVLNGFETFLIQPYVTGGVETILGITTDEKAGKMIMFGLGGIFVEIFKDVNFKLVPIFDTEAAYMINSIKSSAILKGVRGKEAINIEYIKESLLRLSQLANDFPEFIEIDLNPFVFFSEKEKCSILDARMRIR
ncbi:MAG: acetate--CoA ligase family protein [Ignavibacteria bacterium]|nr:acetate--CoA ligase family protein [Ignavibacteria bacterium]